MRGKPPSGDALEASTVPSPGAHPRGGAGDPANAGGAARCRLDLVTVNTAIDRWVAHPDPPVVFRQFARLLVPALCDEVVAVTQSAVTEGAGAPGTGTGAPHCDHAGDTDHDRTRSRHTVRLDARLPPRGRGGDVPGPAGFPVAVTCIWRAREPRAPEVALIELLGWCAAGAVNQARQAAALHEAELSIENLRLALTSNRAIGAAIGVLMARHKLTYAQAFRLLSSTSQRVNLKVAVLAEEVVLTGDLPQ